MKNIEERYQAFNDGTKLQLQNILGCHRDGNAFRFSVWSPKAQKAWLVGDFNHW